LFTIAMPYRCTTKRVTLTASNGWDRVEAVSFRV
jgi:hypothetical protein